MAVEGATIVEIDQLMKEGESYSMRVTNNNITEPPARVELEHACGGGFTLPTGRVQDKELHLKVGYQPISKAGGNMLLLIPPKKRHIG